jgi:hypothetical protein
MSIDFKLELDVNDLVLCERACPILVVEFSGYSNNGDESDYCDLDKNGNPYVYYNGWDLDFDNLPEDVQKQVWSAMDNAMDEADWYEDSCENQAAYADYLYDCMREGY